jgi:hypothetical protein
VVAIGEYSPIRSLYMFPLISDLTPVDRRPIEKVSCNEYDIPSK